MGSGRHRGRARVPSRFAFRSRAQDRPGTRPATSHCCAEQARLRDEEPPRPNGHVRMLTPSKSGTWFEPGPALGSVGPWLCRRTGRESGPYLLSSASPASRGAGARRTGAWVRAGTVAARACPRASLSARGRGSDLARGLRRLIPAPNTFGSATTWSPAPRKTRDAGTADTTVKDKPSDAGYSSFPKTKRGPSGAHVPAQRTRDEGHPAASNTPARARATL
jgi:hypothetical protein